MKKITIKASTDVALIKYWGKKNEQLRLPENGSVSLKLAGLETITTVEFHPDLKTDKITIEGQTDDEEIVRVVEHLDRIRKQFGLNIYAQVVSNNSFPKSTGLSSSGSGFAALTMAAIKSLGLNLSEPELSILARQGSGTACRCVCSGFVEWLNGNSSKSSYSHSLFDQNYWDLRDLVVIVDEGQKKISSTKGHTTAQSSPFYQARQEKIGAKITQIKKHLLEKNFTQLGSLVEKEALEFHSILLTSEPPLIAWYPGTLEVMLAVQKLRAEGLECYFTINTGFNVHVLTLPKYEKTVRAKLEKLSLVKKILSARIGGKPEEINQHLF